MTCRTLLVVVLMAAAVQQMGAQPTPADSFFDSNGVRNPLR